jgi:type IX secretion system PorP/SprF family membrane protein
LVNSAKIFAFWLLTFVSPTVFCQQTTRISQFDFNQMLIHPASVGGQGHITVFTGLKTLWGGIDGAPTTQFITVDGTLLHKHMGWGIEIQNDQAALLNQKKIIFNGSYRIRRGYTSWIALGGGIGIKQHVFDGVKAQAHDETDVAISKFFVSQIRPAVNLSAIYFAEKKYLGISIDNPFRYKINFTKEDRIVVGKSIARVNLSAGHDFRINSQLTFRQSILVKYEHKNPLQVDITPYVIIKNQLTFGAGYRFNESVSFIAQFRIVPELKIGYAYDFQLNELNTASNGSHELLLSYSFLQEKHVFSNPRFF